MQRASPDLHVLALPVSASGSLRPGVESSFSPRWWRHQRCLRTIGELASAMSPARAAPTTKPEFVLVPHTASLTSPHVRHVDRPAIPNTYTMLREMHAIAVRAVNRNEEPDKRDGRARTFVLLQIMKVLNVLNCLWALEKRCISPRRVDLKVERLRRPHQRLSSA